MLGIVPRIEIPGIPKIEPKPVVPKPEPVSPGRGPVGPGRMPVILPKRPSIPACKRAGGSCIDTQKYGLYDATEVEMGESETVKASENKPIAIVGVNGCTGVFFHGDGFVTATHGNPDYLASEADAGASEAKNEGTVTAITIKAPSGSSDYKTVENIVKAAFPDAQIIRSDYDIADEGYFYNFKAKPGDTNVDVEQGYEPIGSE
ncbi:hypothetical protein GP486_001877 [Trichoglossum hirsutum]|uniref:Uncharacterized protein n=1 Tax=Trichoglossum hirsutum TaxID=265104 RepID=A0A9P8LFB1_9PEZI|nr:hypothetical protein GP486_001877 [Trichoglossum hirsutum]